MTKDSEDTCVPAWDEHAGFTDTGRRKTDRATGETFQVWACQCGKKTLDIVPPK
jgi:hypothetical protein